MLKESIHDHTSYRIKLNELECLIEALGYEVRGEVLQTKPEPDVAFLFGRGKVIEMSELVKRQEIDTVFVYNVLTSKQKLNLTRELNAEVLDRYELTLRIFDENAIDALSRLQIELARLSKLFPYYKLQASIALRTEHPSLRSMGEYAFHRKVTLLRKRIAKLRRRIKKLRDEKIKRINARRELGFKTVCISGYFNAGKTSLFNVLTGSRKPVSDQPFTTLSSKYQKRYFEGQSVLFVDTIGFVIGLDPKLIESFELNLQDLRSSDIVLFLVDASDPIPVLFLKLRSGLNFLDRLRVDRDDTLIILSKADLVEPVKRRRVLSSLEPLLVGHDWMWASAKSRENVSLLLRKIAEKTMVEAGPAGELVGAKAD